MSTPLLLKAFVNERLTAAAEEIFGVFERTIAKYEEEASSSEREIQRLRGLLLDLVSNQKTDFSQSPAYEEETPPEQEPCPRSSQKESEPRPIKEEDQGLWSVQQDTNQVQELKNDNVSYMPHSTAWCPSDQEDTKPSVEPQNNEIEKQCQKQKETKTAHLMLSVTSTLSSCASVQNENGHDDRERQRPVESFAASEQTQTEQSQATVLTELFHSVTPDYNCYLCEKSFPTNHHLINHAFQLHSNDAGVLCAVCGKTLESTERLRVHLKSHRRSKSCHVCGKQCSSTTALSEHMTSHTGVKLHRCHVCGKECSRKGDLKIHMRIHTGEKPFCCSYCCKSFTHSGHLRKHMRSHTGERPHRCDVCGRGFLQSVHLKYHLGTHAQKS